jgi:ubiquitin carboxyl-terminal hydrolase L5
LPVNGLLYELDGLREGPRMHAPVGDGEGQGGEQWTEVAREVIEKRIAAYPDGSVRSVDVHLYSSQCAKEGRS